ncbi:MAG TPA: TadE family protein [Candidatus Binatia bacterium]|nr:TadE family protein [Candidatus Binatia bacterium]
MRSNEGRVVREASGRRATEERGSATVEAAIVFPVVLFLIFGIIQGARCGSTPATSRSAPPRKAPGWSPRRTAVTVRPGPSSSSRISPGAP